MKKISRDQMAQVMATLLTNTRWAELDGDLLQQQVIAISPQELGVRFTAFLRNGAQLTMVGSPNLQLPTIPFDLAAFLDPGWKPWRGPANGSGLEGDEDCDPRGLALTEIDWSKVLFPTCLKEGEDRITGEEKYPRLIESGDIRLGPNAFLSLWQDYQANRENSVLEWLYRTKKITYVDFFGLILRRPDGDRCVLYLYRRGGGAWYWYCDWLVYDWFARRGSASLASSELGA